MPVSSSVSSQPFLLGTGGEIFMTNFAKATEVFSMIASAVSEGSRSNP
jgi:hypothetical protein